jgi:hypothetical protein
MALITLPAQYSRPEKLTWVLEGATLDDWRHIPSKSLRKFLGRSEELCREQGITWEIVPLTAELYATWLAFYNKKMLEKGFQLFADENTFAQKRAEGKELHGIFFWRDGVMIAGGVFISTAERISFAYKASEDINLSPEPNANLGAVIDAMYQRYALTLNKRITAGTSRNQFGLHNSLGYLNFKLRFGYKPEPMSETTFTHDVEVNSEGWIVCFVMNEKVLIPLCITTTDAKPSDLLWTEIVARLPNIQTLAL